MPTRTLVLLSMVALMGCASGKSAEKPPDGPPARTFGLTTGDETPPCPAAGPAAQGIASVALAPDGSSLGVTVSYSGLSGPPTAAHVHAGKAGVAGPVVLPFTGELTSPFSKTFTAADYVAAQGAPPDFATFVQSLKSAGSGGAYVNVHTAACKPGEIRGQLP